MNKRYDPAMHTAEHLLTGTIVKRYGCGRPFSTHIERKKTKMDFHTTAAPDREELEEIERTVNRLSAQGLPVREEFMDWEAASIRFDLSRVPEKDGPIRIVHIGEYDSCPCIGDHVENTSLLPPLRIISADSDGSVLRVRFTFL